MKRSEFLAWIKHWESTPFDDAGRYHRPAALVAHSMSGLDIGEAMKWLSRELEPDYAGYSESDINTFKAFGVTPPKRKG
jgi:hypothetical protein